MKTEFDILKRSGIYSITPDSNCITRIRLEKMHSAFVCGNGVPAWLILCGQLPMYMPDNRFYSFRKIKNGDTTSAGFELHVAKRLWFWDMFLGKKNFGKEAGKALAANYYQPAVVVKQ